jgi:CHASE2 domain-containing sensor protein
MNKLSRWRSRLALAAWFACFSWRRWWACPSGIPSRSSPCARTFDFYQVLKPRDARLRPAVIVDIDEASLAAFG